MMQVSSFLPRLCLYFLTRRPADGLLPELDNIFQNSGHDFGSSDIAHPETTVSTEDKKTPELVVYTPMPSAHSSFIIPTSRSEERLNVIDYAYDGYDSPPPLNEVVANTWNERRYRFLLTHEYHSSRRSI
jgi:hypothetical protein